MLILLILSVVFTTLHLVDADCGGTYQSNEGLGGTPIYDFRETFGDAKRCCWFSTKGLIIRRVMLTGFDGCLVTCVGGGSGYDYINYKLKGPSGKRQTIDVYADWTGEPPKVDAGCRWKTCRW